jgi:hypothetical protein
MFQPRRSLCYAIVVLLFFLVLHLLATNDQQHDVSTRIAPISYMLSAVFYLVGTALLSPLGYDDYDKILNKNLDQNIFAHLGAYGVRHAIASDSPFSPTSCRLEVVNTLERHGARLMTSQALKSANATVTKIQAAMTNVSVHSLSSELRFLKTVSLLVDTSSLVPYGALQ